jgi:hypothetical protein
MGTETGTVAEVFNQGVQEHENLQTPAPISQHQQHKFNKYECGTRQQYTVNRSTFTEFNYTNWVRRF